MRKTVFEMVVPLALIFLFATQAKGQNLQDTTVNLKEVVIDSKMIKHEPGKDIVNTTQMRKGKTNLLDLLESLPGLVFMNENISIPGTESVKVMFNGKLKRIPSSQLTQFLKSFQASNVYKVEIIKSTDAKYDAEGNFGIINILTGEHSDYIGGSLGDDISYSTRWRNAMRGNINYNKHHLTASLNAGWEYGKSPYTESYVANYTDMTRHSNSYHVIRRNNYNIVGAIDFQLDTLSTLGFEASCTSGYSRHVGNDTEHQYLSDGNLHETTLSHELSAGPPQVNINLSLYYDRKWSKTRTLTLMADIFKFTDDNKYGFHSEYMDESGILQDKIDKINNTSSHHLKGISAALDYETKLPWDMQLSTGIKGSVTSTNNGLRYEISTLPFQNDDFVYDEYIYAGYATLNKTIGRASFRIGGRYEFTHTDAKPQTGKETTREYGHLFPNVYVLYNLKNGNSLSLSSRGGINRPSIKSLNPFKTYINPYSSNIGNPTIDPSYWYNVQIASNITFKGGEISTMLRYAQVKDIITQISEMNASEGSMLTQWRNAYDKDGCYLDLSFYYTGLRWARLSLLAEMMYEKSYGNSLYSLDKEEVLRPYLYGYFVFYLDANHNLSLSLSSSYSSRNKNATGIIRSNYDVDCGLNYSCMNKRLDLKIRVNHLFASHFRGTSYSSDGMNFVFDNNFSYRRVTLGASYTFGKSIKTKRKVHSNSEIKERF